MDLDNAGGVGRSGRGSGGAGGPPLDRHTGIASAPSGTGRSRRVDSETGEILPPFDELAKWELQAVAREALGPAHRLRICFRHMRPEVEQVEIRERLEGGGRFLGGLQVCGMVWVCPVCAAKVQAVRAREVRAAIEAWQERGGTVLLMTQTFRHSRADDLAGILEPFKDALRRFKSGRRYAKASAVLGLKGTVAGHEVTWGEANGWHPHAHTLLFVRGDVKPEAARQVLWPVWRAVAVKAGLQVDRRAFDIRDGAAVREYVTKLGRPYQWNAEHELVKSHTKRGSERTGLSPFDLLRRHQEGAQGAPWLALFREFAKAYHGKNQLTWSRGWKRDLLGSDGLTDLEVAASIGERFAVLARLTAEQWRSIRRAGHHGGTVLRVFDLAGEEGLRLWVDSIGGRHGTQATTRQQAAGTDRGAEASTTSGPVLDGPGSGHVPLGEPQADSGVPRGARDGRAQGSAGVPQRVGLGPAVAGELLAHGGH